MISPRIALAMLQAGHPPGRYRQRGVLRPWYVTLVAAARRCLVEARRIRP